MAKYEIVSADAHVLEPPDIWANWLPAKYQDKAPQLVKDVDGGDAWLFAGATEPDPIGLVATPGMPFDKFRWTGVTYDEARTGCYEGAARLVDMDTDGVDAEVIYPPQRTIGHFLGDSDDEFVLAGVDAYNNFLWEQFAAPDRSRIVGMAQIPSVGIDVSVDYLRKAKARGFKGVVISNWPSGADGITDDDDAFWAAAEDEGMVVCNHINMFSRRQRQAVRAAARAAAEAESSHDQESGRGAPTALNGTVLGRSGAKARAKAVGGLGGVFGPATQTISNLLFTGVFERFPNLQVAMIEIGVGWIPHFLEQMDDRYWRNRSWGQLPITEPPSFYWYRNMSATFITDRIGIQNRHAAGLDNIMWSTDYPHHGNDWPYSRRVIDEMMSGLPTEEKRKIVADNAVRVFHLDQEPGPAAAHLGRVAG
ncbi:MAG: amidohydrolase family protein [Mycobacteriales bacterium]